jgi:hypothetical protein
MEAEHESSKALFTTRNYGIRTCAQNEWQIVVGQKISAADMSSGKRRVPNVEELLQHPMVQSAKLSRPEVIAVVLYTGPMVCAYVCVCMRERVFVCVCVCV